MFLASWRCLLNEICVISEFLPAVCVTGEVLQVYYVLEIRQQSMKAWLLGSVKCRDLVYNTSHTSVEISYLYVFFILRRMRESVIVLCP